jgi:hypothetical protein
MALSVSSGTLPPSYCKPEFIFFNLSFHVSEFQVGAWQRQLMSPGSGEAVPLPLPLLLVAAVSVDNRITAFPGS